MQASSDGKYAVVLVENGQQVYIKSLLNISQPYKVLDYKDKGVVNAAKWIPNTYQLVICGGNSSETKYFETYDVKTGIKHDLAHLTVRTVLDVTVTP